VLEQVDQGLNISVTVPKIKKSRIIEALLRNILQPYLDIPIPGKAADDSLRRLPLPSVYFGVLLDLNGHAV
jgi:hypothetical protein